MVDLFKHLKKAEQDEEEASIPLLRNEVVDSQSSLFTEEEIRECHRKKRLHKILKISFISASIIIFLILASFRTYHFISYNLQNRKISYNLNSVSVKDASQDGFFLSMNATVTTEIPWSVDLKTLTVIISNSLFKEEIVKMSIPDLRILSGSQNYISFKERNVQILNPKALADLINVSVRDKKAAIPLVVSMDAHVHWTPFTLNNIKIEKTILLDLEKDVNESIDLSKLFKLNDLKMEETSGDDLIITADGLITNPLPVSIDTVPELAFKVFSDQKIFIGRVKTIGSFSLQSGSENRVKLEGILTSSESHSQASAAIGRLISNHLTGKVSRIYLRGDIEAFQNLNWLQAIIANLDVPIDIPGSKGGMFDDSIKRIDVKKIFVSLDPEKPNQISLDSDTEVHFHVPRIASLMRPTIERISLDGQVRDLSGNFLAPLTISEHVVKSDPSKNNTLETKMRLDINIDSTNRQNVESMIAEMLCTDSTCVSVSGTSSIKSKMILGRVSIPRVKFDAEVNLPGIGRILANQQPDIEELQIESVDENEMKLRAIVVVDNPTSVSSRMGLLHMRCMIEDSRKYLGDVWLVDSSLNPGKNLLSIRIIIPSSEAVNEFIGNYVSGRTQSLILQGIEGSSNVHPILKNVMGAFVMHATMRPSAVYGQFVSAVTLRRRGFNVLPNIYMTVSNPFDFSIEILSIQDIKIFAYKSETGEKVLISEMSEVPLKEPIIIPPHVKNWIDEENPLPLQMNSGLLRNLRAVEMLFNKNNPADERGKKYLPIRLEGRIRSAMAKFELEFIFIKDKLPLYVEIGL